MNCGKFLKFLTYYFFNITQRIKFFSPRSEIVNKFELLFLLTDVSTISFFKNKKVFLFNICQQFGKHEKFACYCYRYEGFVLQVFRPLESFSRWREEMNCCYK